MATAFCSLVRFLPPFRTPFTHTLLVPSLLHDGIFAAVALQLQDGACCFSLRFACRAGDKCGTRVPHASLACPCAPPPVRAWHSSLCGHAPQSAQPSGRADTEVINFRATTGSQGVALLRETTRIERSAFRSNDGGNVGIITFGGSLLLMNVTFANAMGDSDMILTSVNQAGASLFSDEPRQFQIGQTAQTLDSQPPTGPAFNSISFLGPADPFLTGLRMVCPRGRSLVPPTLVVAFSL